jgi:hypothetical protein
MSNSRTDLRRPKLRRLVLVVVAAVVVLAVTAAVVVMFALRPAAGVCAALEEESFTSCLEREGRPEDEPSMAGADSYDEDEEVEFWSHPLALHCATIALNEDRRTRALSIAFPSLEGERPGGVADQWTPVMEYAVWLESNDVPQDIAMMRIASVLDTLWIGDAEKGNWADGFVDAAVLADMRARDELPGFDAWLAQQDPEDEVDLFEYRAAVLEKGGEGTEEAFDDYWDRSRALYDVVR